MISAHGLTKARKHNLSNFQFPAAKKTTLRKYCSTNLLSFYDFFYSSLCGIALIVYVTSPVLPLVQSHAEICIQREQKNGIHDLISLTHRVLFFP